MTSKLQFPYESSHNWSIILNPYEVKYLDTCQDPDKVVFNFSSYNLSDNEEIPLSKGLRFAIPLKTIEYSEFLVPFEML